jgi:hypothetical protein
MLSERGRTVLRHLANRGHIRAVETDEDIVYTLHDERTNVIVFPSTELESIFWDLWDSNYVSAGRPAGSWTNFYITQLGTKYLREVDQG